MPVVINDFEAVADAPAATSGAASADADAGDAQQKIDPAELQKALTLLRERELRVWAH